MVDWQTLNARSKFWGDDQRAAFKNWGDVDDVRNDVGSAQGIAEQVQLRELLRRVIQKVMAENKLDVMIQLHSALPPGKIGLAPEPVVNDRSPSYSFGPNAGITEVLIPAGYVRVAYDADLRADDRRQRPEGLPRQDQHARRRRSRRRGCRSRSTSGRSRAWST